MNIINSHYDEDSIKDAIAVALENFYSSLIKKIDEIDISTIMKAKNPYLYRSKAIQSASDIIESVLSAFVSSSEETIFGNCFFEPIAIAASNGRHSVAEGIDLEVVNDGTLYAIAVKSGTSVFNADSKKRQIDNFTRARRTATQGRVLYEAIIGYAYGQKSSVEKVGNIAYELAGEDFWTVITGDKDFYKKLIEFMGQLPERYVDSFNISYANASNRLVRDFSTMFCRDDGSIDWEKLVEYNSGSLTRQKNEAFERQKQGVIEYLLSHDLCATKKALAESIGVSTTQIGKVINSLKDSGILEKDTNSRQKWIVHSQG